MVQTISYSEEIAQEILKKFNAKGWNLYHKTGLEKTGRDGVIKNNLADKLEMDVSYVLLPAAENPREPASVMNALEKLGKKLNREMPTIQVGFEYHPLTGITLNKDYVKIHTPEGTYVDYETFMSSLESIVQTN
jgi:hypothetical protein